MPVESVVHCKRNSQLIAEAAKLWIRDTDLILDVTYGKGLWWNDLFPTDYHVLRKHDIVIDGIDFRKLPEADSSVDVVAFDPPYVCKGGRTTSGITEFDNRYGLGAAPRTPAEMMDMIAGGIVEAARVLRPSGRLLAKTMDYVTSGHYIIGHHHVVTTAMSNGLIQVDEFVHYSGTGPQPPGRRQLHSRRAHSFLCVFQKPPLW